MFATDAVDYDGESVSSGPPLEAVVTIPIHPGTGAKKGREKAFRYYTLC